MIDNISIFAWTGSGTFGVPETVALAAVAAFGYLFGRQSRRRDDNPVTEQARRELKRATSIAQELERIAATIRKDLASHHSKVARFKTIVAKLSRGNSTVSQDRETLTADRSSGDGEREGATGTDTTSTTLQDLCGEAEKILAPTLQLATQLAHAYDQIRQQSTQLLDFTEGRTDPLTGVRNRRALDEQLDVMFAMMNRYDRPFSICIIDIDHFKKLNDQEGHLSGDQALQQVAKLIDQSVRGTDVVARYGGEEFVVVMPQTELTGASIFAERTRALIEEEMSLTISGGIAEATEDDTKQALLSRADSALYSAKANGRNCHFVHTGKLIRPYRTESNASAAPSRTAPEDEAESVECEIAATV